MFWVIKTQHEEAIGEFPREVEERFFEIGKNMAKTCSVFLHKNVQHAVDEWWISFPGGSRVSTHPTDFYLLSALYSNFPISCFHEKIFDRG